MRRAATMLASLALLAALPASASAAFGFADVNSGAPNVPSAPAFPTTKAIWAGTCNLASGSTANGGVGSAPAIRAHCIDVGETPFGSPTPSTSPWPAGEEPDWRLDPVTAAGAHPDASATFWFNYKSSLADGDVKNVIVKLPPGVVGNPEAVDKCAALEAQASPPQCPASSQIGITTIGFPANVATEISNFQTRPIYAIEARDTVTAEFTIASIASSFNVPITARGRTNGDYGIDTLALLIPQFAPFGGQAASFWGVPWAAEHDRFRIEGIDAGILSQTAYVRDGYPADKQVPYESSWGPIKPFFTNPTECSGKPLPVEVQMDSWQDPVFEGFPWVTGVSEADPLTECDELAFDPTIALRPTVEVADSPSGLDVRLSIPQNNEPPASIPGNPDLAHDPDDANGAPAYWASPAGRAIAHLKDTTVSLPAGTSFNPAAANGLRGCTTAQIGLTATSPKVTFNNDPHNCPDTAKIGTLEIVSPLLPDPLQGAVYAAPQGDNPFPGSLTAIYMVSQDTERGLSIKLAGKVDLDPATGQIATTFLDNPQLPFETFELHFKTGPRAPLNTPAVCGQFKNQIDLTPWSHPHSGPIVNVQDPFDIGAMPNGLACVTEPEDRVFAPGFKAGSTNPQAGAHTDFVLNVTRADGNQELSALALQMPPGLSAKLAGTPYCPDATLAAIEARSGLEETNAPACPAASQLGTVNSLAGAGPTPLPTSGKLYFAGPYDPDAAGPKALAPVSVAAVVPAIAGGIPGDPAFDLGNLVIRSAAYVDAKTATVRIDSTPLPYILGGVPLRVREVAVDIDKPGFMLNPTNCNPMSVGAGLGGAADPFDAGDDVAVGASSPFQVRNCAALGFKPRLTLRLRGGTKRGRYPALTAVLTARPGDANIARTSVAFPPSEFLANEHIRTVCTRPDFAADKCPRGSIYGFARAWSPLLDQPLQGNVYLRSSDNLLPDLVADLRGPAHQPIKVELVGRTDSIRGGIRNTFDVVPDAPVSRFVLRMRGGAKGLLVNSRDICKRTYRATVKMNAQNGRAVTLRPKLRAQCGKKGKGKKGKAKRGGHRRGRGR